MTGTKLSFSHVLPGCARDEIYLLPTSHYFLNYEIQCSTKLKPQISSAPPSYLVPVLRLNLMVSILMSTFQTEGLLRNIAGHVAG